MSCDTKLFIQNGINAYQLSKYIESKYGKSEIIEASSIDAYDAYSIYFEDKKGEPQRIWCFTFKSTIDDDTPVSIIDGKSCMLSIGYYCDGNSVEILQDIAQNFGGGFIQINDCGSFDGTDEWRYVDGSKNVDYVSSTEIEVFKLVQDSKYKNGLNSVQLTKFILAHLDEIRKIEK